MADPVKVANNPRQDRMVKARERDLMALQLRQRGFGFDEMAKKMGFSNPGQAWTCWKRGMDHSIREAGEETRRLENDRLDALWKIMFDKALGGSHLAVDRCIAIMDRRARLLGLDAPIRIRQEVITQDQLVRAIAELEAANAQLEAQIVEREGSGGIVDAEVVEDDLDESPDGGEMELYPGHDVDPVSPVGSDSH